MSLALYRKYRPGRFADVVGQEHVTEPLARALAKGRLHHAYLFSGPRGCGKTSTARILARSLNCERGPTPDPCGECRSCIELAPNGPGSIDVIELDAATHGLVDDARELREKAHFAPVSSRFKIYIIDEAHQLGPGAANALLKIIEEPPPHLMFIFATTAPDKILGTIRSRTHHYPFRLIPGSVLIRNLATICEREGMPIEPAALALAARAGAGSARDAQSVLGQLIAGAGDDGVTYELAHRLLGFTDVALLDELVEAIAASDGATVFGAIDKVMDSGHDPRRFLTDLLERFRDLIVLSAVPNAVDQGLLEEPDDHVQQLTEQAARFGPSDLVRLASVIDEGITAMKGATPTRLQLEMVCARLLLPAADDSTTGLAARLDRLERRMSLGGAAVADADRVPPRVSVQPAAREPARPGIGSTDHSGSLAQPSPEAQGGPAAGGGATGPTTPVPGGEAAGSSGAVGQRQVPSEPAAQQSPNAAAGAASKPGGPDITDIRRLWPEILERLREIKRTPWSLISQNAVALAFDGSLLTLAFSQPNLRDTFQSRDDFQTYLRQAIRDVTGLDVKFESIVDPSADPGAKPATNPGRSTPRSDPGMSWGDPAPGGGGDPWQSSPATRPAPQGNPHEGSFRHDAATSRRQGQAPPTAGPAGGPAAAARPPAAGGTGSVRPGSGGQRPGRSLTGGESQQQGGGPSPAAGPAHGDDAAHGGDADPNDPDLDESGLSHRQLLERTLGAQVIQEIEHP